MWCFPHQCVLNGLSIEQGLADVAASHAQHPSELCLPFLLLQNALFAWTGVDTPGVARLFLFFYHYLLAVCFTTQTKLLVYSQIPQPKDWYTI